MEVTLHVILENTMIQQMKFHSEITYVCDQMTLEVNAFH